MYLDEAKRLYAQLDLARLVACTEDRVVELEEKLKIKLPTAYREFLMWAGELCGDLFPDNFFYYLYMPPHIYGYETHKSVVYDRLPNYNGKSTLDKTLSQASKLSAINLNTDKLTEMIQQKEAQERAIRAKLPEDAFICLGVGQESDEVFYFFHLSDGDNPPIYRLSSQIETFPRVADSLSEWVLEEVKKHERRLEHLKKTYGLDKPLRETHHLDALKAKYAELKRQPPKPCTVDEVLRLEKRHGYAFPDAFREFLVWGGHWADIGMQGSEFFYPYIYDLKASAEGLLRDNQHPEPLPEDAIVFFMHQGYQFAFTRPSTGEDAQVYFYLEGENAQIEHKGTFADYISSYIDWIVELEKRAAASPYKPVPILDEHGKQIGYRLASKDAPQPKPANPETPKGLIALLRSFLSKL